MCKVSVVIPCYNQGEYIEAAVQSVLGQTYRDFEIIIVNDGSTDQTTNQILAQYARPHTRVLHTENQGLASARNTGIREACGEYILPLDSDDYIGASYLEKAVSILDNESQVGIVYCLAECFGAQIGRWIVPDFSLKGMLFSNLIFCTALYRKTDWERVGGYKPNMRSGWEDWDFWLSILENGMSVHRIPEVLFHYYVKDHSMVRSMTLKTRIEMHQQLMSNHPKLFIDQVRPLLEMYYRVRDSLPYRLAKRLRLTSLIGRLLGRQR